MKILNINSKIKINDELTLTIGNFDGIHTGHKELINLTKKFKDTKSAALTFDPHPKKLFIDDNFKTLYNLEGKINLFKKTNIDYLFIAPFTKSFSKLSVSEFINILKSINVKRLVLGSDFKFAYKASGKISDLKKYFEVIEVNVLKDNKNNVISTSYIKDMLSLGEIIKANKLLGYKYFVYGNVEHGNKVGRTLGFPTANINYGDVFLPKCGVYFTKIEIDGKLYDSISNIGFNPTVNESRTKKLETYILNFNKSIYDKNVIVYFYERIREEVKFNSVDELIDAMKNDEKIALKLIKKYKL